MANKGTEKDGRPRLGGIGEYITHEIEKMTGVETRNTILGHIQRGGAPTGYDRVLATRLGMGAVDMVAQKQWGKMVSVQGTEIKYVPLEEALDGLKSVPQERWGRSSRPLRSLNPASSASSLSTHTKTAEAGTRNECPPPRFYIGRQMLLRSQML